MGYAQKYDDIQKCTMGGCGTLWYPGACKKCGFNKDEAERRRKLPMEVCPDGLRRKILRRWSQDVPL